MQLIVTQENVYLVFTMNLSLKKQSMGDTLGIHLAHSQNGRNSLGFLTCKLLASS